MKNNGIKLKDVLRTIGGKGIVAAVAVLLTVSAIIAITGYSMYGSAKQSMFLQGELNAKESAKQYDNYLMSRANPVMAAGNIVDNMLQNGSSSNDIQDYMVQQTVEVQNNVDSSITGFYGWIGGAYLDGGGWVPDEDYIATERPWYTEAIESEEQLTFVKPYLDMQTNTVMMTMSDLLSDEVSVLSLDISLERLQEIAEEIAASTPGSFGIVLGRDGTVIAHSEEGELGHNYLQEEGSLGSQVAQIVLTDGKHQGYVTYGDSTYVVYAEDIQGGWLSVSLINANTYYGSLKTILAASIVVLLLALAAMLVNFINMGAKRLIERNLNTQLGTVADIYLTMHDIDLATDTYRKITHDREDEEATMVQNGAQAALIARMEYLSEGDDKSPIMDFIDLSTLPDRLRTTDTVTEEFLEKDGLWCRGRFIAAERDKEGRVSRVMWLVESIDAEKRRRDALLRLSEMDQMTGINNRTSGERKIIEFMSQGRGGMLIVLDIDKFKSINDTFGHQVGDKVIVAVADAIRATFRSDDVILRLGGDEFSAYALGVYDQEKGAPILRRLFRKLESAVIPELEERPVFVSVGASFLQDGEPLSFKDLYARADTCTYASKKTIGNCFTFYDGSL